MSDVGILSDWQSIAGLCLIMGAPGGAIGAVIGALVGRNHRIRGAVIGTIAGFALCLAGALLWVVY